MFDPVLLDDLVDAHAVFWAGVHPPLATFAASARIYDPNCDFRESPEAHGAFDAVVLVEQDFACKQWPLILDEALRLLKPGCPTTLILRGSESALLTISELAAFLRRRSSVDVEIRSQHTNGTHDFTYVLTCHRTDATPTLDSMEFALITDGKRMEKVHRFITSVKAIDGIESIDWTVAVCGPVAIASELDQYGPRIRLVPEPAEHAGQGWITRKKNLIVASGTAENVLVAHDRYEVPPEFLGALRGYGADFDVLIPAQHDMNGDRFPDWVALSSAWSWTRIGMLEYDDYHPNMYVNGGAVIAKRAVLTETPWSELLFWNQGEDIELTRILGERGVTPRLARQVALLVTDARPGYTQAFGRYPMLRDRYATLPGTAGLATREESPYPLGQWVSLAATDVNLLADQGVVAPAADWELTPDGAVPQSSHSELVLDLNDAPDAPLVVELELSDEAHPAPIVRVNRSPIPMASTQSTDGRQRLRGSTPSESVGTGRVIRVGIEMDDTTSCRAIRLSRQTPLSEYPIEIGSDVGDRTPVLASGWSYIEPWGAWSEGRTAVLTLPLPPTSDREDALITLELSAFAPPGSEFQAVGVSCNAVPIGFLHVPATSEPTAHEVRIPRSLVGDANEATLTLTIARPSSPALQGTATESRRIGIGLYRIDASTTRRASPNGTSAARRAIKKVARVARERRGEDTA
jgi:hypothetical protein